MELACLWVRCSHQRCRAVALQRLVFLRQDGIEAVVIQSHQNESAHQWDKTKLHKSDCESQDQLYCPKTHPGNSVRYTAETSGGDVQEFQIENCEDKSKLGKQVSRSNNETEQGKSPAVNEY